MKDQKKSCPSAVCEPGSKLIGIVNSQGMVDLLPKAIDVDEEFVLEAQKGRAPEERFRFSGKCVQSGCHQWKGGGCGVIKKVLNAFPETTNANLPACAIRKTCRWYFQEGGKACMICPLIITDNEKK